MKTLIILFIVAMACITCTRTETNEDESISHLIADKERVEFKAHHLHWGADRRIDIIDNKADLLEIGVLSRFIYFAPMFLEAGFSAGFFYTAGFPEDNFFEESFFEENYLLVFGKRTPSCCIRHEVVEVSTDGTIYMNRMMPFWEHDTSVGETFVIELSKSFMPDSFRIQVDEIRLREGERRCGAYYWTR
jgi:hypothetical protein